MAKRKPVTENESESKQPLSTQDKRTMSQIVGFAEQIGRQAGRHREPAMDIPTRSLSNVKFNTSKRILEMGRKTTQRQLFNLNQAKSFMQTCLVAGGAKKLIEMGKTTSIRGLYYMLKHDIRPTKEPTFHDQGECDPIIEDCEVLLDSLREELHLFADKKGDMVGEITINDKGVLSVSKNITEPYEMTVQTYQPSYYLLGKTDILVVPPEKKLSAEPKELVFETAADSPLTVKAAWEPENIPASAMIWKASKEGFVEITPAEDGSVTVKPLKKGKISLTVTGPAGKKATVKITIKAD